MMNLGMAMTTGDRLVHLAPVDLVIVVFYFVLVLAIGFYLKGRSNTGEDFFLAGREMTAWIAGLSFLSANLGALELMGWAAASYQYGILAAHWYWIGAIPAMLFLGLVMMPFYYISKTHSVPGYLKLRFGEASRALSAIARKSDQMDAAGIPRGYLFDNLSRIVGGTVVHHNDFAREAGGQRRMNRSFQNCSDVLFFVEERHQNGNSGAGHPWLTSAACRSRRSIPGPRKPSGRLLYSRNRCGSFPSDR